MKKILLPFFLLAFSTSFAQLVVDTTQTPGSVVENVFLSNGIFVANVTYNGVPMGTANGAVGSFTAANTGLGIDAGIIMTSGSATNASGPNDETGSTAISTFGVSNDPDLDLLVTSYSYDGSIIEFDFIATGDSLDFVYIFGSEEYEEFVGSAFNDVFGFFVSGPGINGTFTNNAVNIATIPGTSDPVAINTVNAGLNSQYFVLNNQVTDIQYDGHTTPLHASIGGLTIGESYHIKLAVADISDSVLDSGVFLSGSSFVQVCADESRDACMVSHIMANVHYTETCGVVEMFNSSEVNIATTGCHYDMGDGNTVDACDGLISYTYDEPGTYPIKLIYNVNEFYSTFTVGNLYVSDTPPVEPVLVQNGNMLEIANYDGLSSYQWYLNGAAIAGATGSSYNATESGSYTVTAANGCLSTSDALNAIVSSIADPNFAVLSVFPNPSNGQFIVTLPTGTTELEVFNVLGSRVMNMNTANRNQVDMSLESGVYTLVVKNVNGTSEIEKVIVR